MNGLFIGTIAKDVLMLVKEPPESDRRIEAYQMVESCGGPAATAANAFAALGGRAGLVTAIGDDPNAAFVLKEAERIAGRQLQVFTAKRGVTSFSAIQVEQDGKRCITHYGGCIDALRPEGLDQGLLDWAGIIHLAGMKDQQILDCAAYCKEHSGAILSVDGGNLGGDTLTKLCGIVDVMIPDHKTVWKELKMKPMEACGFFLQKGAPFACVTMGENGLAARCGTEAYQVPACRVRAVDTTGAGDNFHGAFLYAVSTGLDTEKALRFASAFSARTCQGLGGQQVTPGFEETCAFMDQSYK